MPNKTEHTSIVGADQIMLQSWDYPSSWIKSIRDGKTGKTYSFEEFNRLFANQVKRGSK